jgi:cell division protein FtsB
MDAGVFNLKRHIFIVATILFLGITTYQLLISDYSFISLYQLRKENESLKKEIAIAEKEIEDRQKESIRLQKDSSYIEYLARTRLGMSLDGEEIFLFVNDSLKQAP